MKITLVTGNWAKIAQAKEFLEPKGIIVNNVKMDTIEIQADSVEEVARYSAKWASEKLKANVVKNDTGIMIDGLGGFPGPYTHYVQDTLGNQGILKLLADTDDRYAEFRSVIGYCAPNSEPKIFLGKVSGEIAVEEKGDLGFAFDPIFYVPSLGKTFGELTTDEKNQFSHRKNSLEQFIKWYSSQE